MKRTALHLPIMVLTILAAVFGFAAVTDAITINGSLAQDGPLVFQFRTDPAMAFVANSFMSQDYGTDETSDAGMYNVSMTGQDLAATTGTFSGNSGDGTLDTLTATVTNPYPGYYNELSVKVTNVGADPIVMPEPALNWLGQPVPLVDGVVTPLYDTAGNQVAEVRWLDNTGRTLCPGQVFEEAFEFHVLSVPTPPQQQDLSGLTPGYWKNWRNHYTAEQFTALLAGTIASDISSADAIFAHYNAKQSDVLTILRAQLLAAQLTVNLSGMPQMPNPGSAYLSLAGRVEWNNGTVTVGEAVNNALTILANPSAYTRGEILGAKDLLDMINNLEQARNP